MKDLTIFLPEIAAHQLDTFDSFNKIKDSIVIEPLKQDWQALFCQKVAYVHDDLPWSQLRMAQFNISDKVKTICRCDPVLLQLTHRGAYMLGQAQLQLSQNDAIRIVAHINDQLMREGENLYLVDKNAWLYTNERSLTLASSPFHQLVGKDMFNFSYQGDDALYWQQLSTEIQMLIKQMMDYQGLDSPAPETMLNVHFSDCLKLNHKRVEDEQVIPFIKNDAMTLVSDNELIKSFCSSTFLSYAKLDAIQNIETDNCIIIAFDNEKETYSDIIAFWANEKQLMTNFSGQIICQDATIGFKSQASFLKRLLNKFV